MDFDLGTEMARCTAGVLTFDGGRHTLAYDGGRTAAHRIEVGDAQLRNWLQTLLLSSWRPPTTTLPHERAIEELLVLAEHHARRGEDPFLRFRRRHPAAEARLGLAG